MIRNNEEKAKEFLKYIGENANKLKKALLKNVTYNKEIVDDILGETILKVYNTILKNGTEIESIEDYFFIALKFTYIYRDNQNKEYEDITIRGFNFSRLSNEEEINKQERYENHLEILDKIKGRLKDIFNENHIELFFKYYKIKVSGRFSLKEFCEDYNLNEKETAIVFKNIKDFIKNDEIIKEFKRKI